MVTLTITNKDCNNFPEDEFRTEVLNILCCLKSIVNKAKLVLHAKEKVKIPEAPFYNLSRLDSYI